jgi:hypothetical protein
MQQASTAVEQSVLHALHSLSMFSGVFQDITGLYNVLDMRPAMEGGVIDYPEDKFADRAGMSIEFKYVFRSSLLTSPVLIANQIRFLLISSLGEASSQQHELHYSSGETLRNSRRKRWDTLFSYRLLETKHRVRLW